MFINNLLFWNLKMILKKPAVSILFHFRKFTSIRRAAVTGGPPLQASLAMYPLGAVTGGARLRGVLSLYPFAIKENPNAPPGDVPFGRFRLPGPGVRQ